MKDNIIFFSDFSDAAPIDAAKNWEEAATEMPLVAWDEFGKFIKLPNYSGDIHQQLIDIADIDDVTDFSFYTNKITDEIGFAFFSSNKAVVDELFSQIQEQLKG